MRLIKARKSASKSKADMGFLSEHMDSFMGEFFKVQKVLFDFIEAHVGHSVREEEMMMLHFL